MIWGVWAVRFRRFCLLFFLRSCSLRFPPVLSGFFASICSRICACRSFLLSCHRSGTEKNKKSQEAWLEMQFCPRFPLLGLFHHRRDSDLWPRPHNSTSSTALMPNANTVPRNSSPPLFVCYSDWRSFSFFPFFPRFFDHVMIIFRRRCTTCEAINQPINQGINCWIWAAFSDASRETRKLNGKRWTDWRENVQVSYVVAGGSCLLRWLSAFVVLFISYFIPLPVDTENSSISAALFIGFDVFRWIFDFEREICRGFLIKRSPFPVGCELSICK